MSIWQDDTKAIPKSDPKISRVPFNKNDIGARESQLAGLAPKNENQIKHVKGT